MSYRKAVFSLDALAHFFHGLTSGQNWNGFACPFFTHEEGMRLVCVNNSTEFSGRLVFDADKDAFLFFEHEGDNEEPSVYSASLINGVKFYPIGACGWTWNEVTEDEKARFSAELFKELAAMKLVGMNVPDKAFTVAASEVELEDLYTLSITDAADLAIQLATVE